MSTTTLADLKSGGSRVDTRKRLGQVAVFALQEYGILIAFLLVVMVFSSRSANFLTQANLLNILAQMSILGLLATGMTLLLITANFDLSIGSILGLGGALSLRLATGHSLWIALAVAVLAGVAVGLVNGLIVVKAGINSLIVTLGMMSLIRGVVLIYSDGTSIQGTNARLTTFANGTHLIPNIAWVMIIGAIGMGYVLTQTRSGRYFQGSGGNPEATELAGINVDKYKILAFAVMGGLAAVAGILYAGRVNSVDPTAGTGFELQAIAAVIIGGTSLAGGSGAVWKSIVGAALLTTLTNGFNLLNIPSYYQYVIQGVVIILSVALYTRKTKR